MGMNYTTASREGEAGRKTPTGRIRLYPEIPDDFPALPSKDNIHTHPTPLTTERPVNCVPATSSPMSESGAQREVQHSTLATSSPMSECGAQREVQHSLTEHVEGSELGPRPKDTHSHHGGHYQRHDWDNVEYAGKTFEVDPVLVEKYKDDNKSKFEYFWRSESVYSQWCMTEFVVDGTKYTCAEQFMMHRKAMLFEDYRTARKIMETISPRKQEQLGSQVRYFDEDLWQANCDAIVEEGNMAKFNQNKELLIIICASNPKILVLASPLDRIWGIGLSSDDPRAWNRATWNGENKLGKALTKVRCQLMLEKELILKEEYDEQLKELER
ncbi:uncharacterized protein [Argopecten irradians]|uniref:uncharacterized protein n=1 Tax=Argopecten irradians TaxID=31199 RepID=UPI003718B062